MSRENHSSTHTRVRFGGEAGFISDVCFLGGNTLVVPSSVVFVSVVVVSLLSPKKVIKANEQNY